MCRHTSLLHAHTRMRARTHTVYHWMAISPGASSTYLSRVQMPPPPPLLLILHVAVMVSDDEAMDSLQEAL